MDKKDKIYIAGHNGMVGSSIIKKLQSKGYTNLIYKSSKELDLRCQKDVNIFFQIENPQFVFIAAAKVGGIIANNTFRAEFIYDNLVIQSNLINASKENNVKKLLFLGSSCIYPKNCKQPIKEKYLLTGPLEITNEPYAIAKIDGLKLCESYYHQYGCEFISLMPTNLYGPNDNYGEQISNDNEMKIIGEELTSIKGYSCVTCHGIGDVDAKGGIPVQSINFQMVPQRLRKIYYHRFMINPQRIIYGTSMPKYTIEDGSKTWLDTKYEGDSYKQFDSIWEYMSSISN